MHILLFKLYLSNFWMERQRCGTQKFELQSLAACSLRNLEALENIESLVIYLKIKVAQDVLTPENLGPDFGSLPRNSVVLKKIQH